MTKFKMKWKSIVEQSSLVLTLAGALSGCSDDGGNSSEPSTAQQSAPSNSAQGSIQRGTADQPANASQPSETNQGTPSGQDGNSNGGASRTEERMPSGINTSDLDNTDTRNDTSGNADNQSQPDSTPNEPDNSEDQTDNTPDNPDVPANDQNELQEPAPGANCDSATITPGETTRTIEVEGLNRTYILHVPDTYTGEEPVPLLFDFHGLGGTGQQQRNGSSFVSETESDSVIMVFPTGTSDGNGNGWNVGTCCSSDNDVAFTRAMVADIQSEACIDNKRIYATGFSNGGGMSYRLACEAADLFAAVAPASFDLAEDNVDSCNPSRPISVIAQRGTNDFAVPFNGGPTPVTNRIVFLGAQETFDTWGDLNSCTDGEENIGNNCVQRDECGEATEITMCVIQGGGHQPGIASLLWPVLREYTMP